MAALVPAALALILPGSPLVAGTSELVVANPHTGLAISGFDPVAYFTNGAPIEGRLEYELRFEHGVFRFRNEGNRAAFEANPEVYMPQHGGYDPIALARGVALPGNPLEWLIVGNRLYLFYSNKEKAAFAANPREAIAAASERWPEVMRSLIR